MNTRSLMSYLIDKDIFIRNGYLRKRRLKVNKSLYRGLTLRSLGEETYQLFYLDKPLLFDGSTKRWNKQIVVFNDIFYHISYRTIYHYYSKFDKSIILKVL